MDDIQDQLIPPNQLAGVSKKPNTLFLALFGLVFVLFAFFGEVVSSASSTDVVVEGRVVGTVERSNSSTEYAVVQFTDPATQEVYEVTSNYGTNPGPRIGSTREVAFDSDDPASGKVLEGTLLFFIFGAVGTGIMALAAWMRFSNFS